jgi:hypothetical protein
LDAVLNRFDYLHDAPGGRFGQLVLALVTVALLAIAITICSHGRNSSMRNRSQHQTTLHELRKPLRSAVARHPKPLPAARPERPEPTVVANVEPAGARRRKIAAATPIIRSIALGETPKAFIDIGGRMLAVGLGSGLERNVVTEIDSEGVLLNDGERLRLRKSPR